MRVYKIDDVINVLQSMKNDQFEYVDISIIDIDGETTLNVEAVISESDTETDVVDSVSLPDNYYLNV